MRINKTYKLEEREKEYNEKIKKKSYCEDCKKKGRNILLDRSHLISRKERPDLLSCVENVTTMCRRCHEYWESNTSAIKLKKFEYWMDIVYELDQTVFWKRLNKMLSLFPEEKTLIEIKKNANNRN